jgi:hypothetical protein
MEDANEILRVCGIAVIAAFKRAAPLNALSRRSFTGGCPLRHDPKAVSPCFEIPA